MKDEVVFVVGGHHDHHAGTSTHAVDPSTDASAPFETSLLRCRTPSRRQSSSSAKPFSPLIALRTDPSPSVSVSIRWLPSGSITIKTEVAEVERQLL